MKLQEECEEILRTLISRHGAIQPDNPDFDVWSKQDAAEIVADLIQLINASSVIQYEHTTKDWGK